MRANYEKKLKLLKIMDDDFARLVFQDQQVCFEVLRILNVLQDETEIIHYETQYDINNPANRSIELDVCVITDEKVVDIEIENKRSEATPLRARLHASQLDVHISNPGSKFQTLPMSIVIFICNFDYFQKGLSHYLIERTIKGLELNFEDKSKIIYVNGDYEGNDEIGQMVHDMKCINPNEMYNEVLRNRVKYFKENEGGKKVMCKIWDDIKKEGIEEGIKEGQLEATINSLHQIMINLQLTLIEAMNALGLPLEEKDFYENKLLALYK